MEADQNPMPNFELFPKVKALTSFIFEKLAFFQSPATPNMSSHYVPEHFSVDVQ